MEGWCGAGLLPAHLLMGWLCFVPCVSLAITIMLRPGFALWRMMSWGWESEVLKVVYRGVGQEKPTDIFEVLSVWSGCQEG